MQATALVTLIQKATAILSPHWKILRLASKLTLEVLNLCESWNLTELSFNFWICHTALESSDSVVFAFSCRGLQKGY